MKTKSLLTSFVMLSITLCSQLSMAEDFSKGWKFIKQHPPIAASPSDWQTVSIPHTWNAIDAQNGGGIDKHSRDGYYRGPASYAKTFSLTKTLMGKRLFLRFEAVSSAAEVFLNGARLGEHKGAFGAFTFEITDAVNFDQPNDLRVQASNAWDEMIPPLAGDFPIFGGIYRPVELIVKNPVCISPLQNGSHGVFLRQHKVSDQSATLHVTTLLDNAKTTSAKVNVSYKLLDAKGTVVAQNSNKQRINAKATTNSSVSLTVDKPRLWQGRIAPYLYTLQITVSEGDKLVDEFAMKQGFRYFHIDPQKGFFLNGKSYPLWGVNRHQDHENKGWALSDDDHKLDMDIMYEMGVRSIRLAHYPHAETVFELADEMGILVTAELPIVDTITDAPEFRENTIQQVKEIVDLQGNHTSVFAYGVYNELYQRKSPPAETLLTEMSALFKQLDPTRYTYGATNKGGRMDLNRTTELLAFNGYRGWYRGESSEISVHLAEYLEFSEGRGIAVSEYGAGASIKHHETRVKKPIANSNWHPEQYQTQHHEIQFTVLKNTPAVWGTYVWNMFDFASVWRNEGDRPGINDKGLVTHDRKTRKDAFYFYKANLSKEPVLYITSRRHTRREQKSTPIKIYSNHGAVTLTINGKVIGTQKPSDMRIALWDDVELEEGENVIEVSAGKHTDTCVWIVETNSASI